MGVFACTQPPARTLGSCLRPLARSGRLRAGRPDSTAAPPKEEGPFVCLRQPAPRRDGPGADSAAAGRLPPRRLAAPPSRLAAHPKRLQTVRRSMQSRRARTRPAGRARPEPGRPARDRPFAIACSTPALSSQSSSGPAGGASDGYGLGLGAAGPGCPCATTAAGELRVRHRLGRSIRMSDHAPPQAPMGNGVTGGPETVRDGREAGRTNWTR